MKSYAIRQCLAAQVDCVVELFSDGRAVGGGRGVLSVAISSIPDEIPVRAMRLAACCSTGGGAAEIEWREIARCRSEIRSGALIVRAPAKVTKMPDRIVDRGEVSARLSESMSHDIIRVEISRSGAPLVKIETRRVALEAAIAVLAALDE